MVHKEKRKGIKPIPDNPLGYLNDAQQFTYRRITASGWRIKFIRRPMYQNPVCVMTDPDETMLALIEKNGYLNKQPDIPLRSNERCAKE